MVRFEKISVTEKSYPFVNATVAADYANGTFGTVTDGVFTAGATGFYVIMNLEKGDDATSDDYVIKAGEPARIADLSQVDGAALNITRKQLPTTIAKGDKAVSKADGTLEVPVNHPTLNYIEITDITRFGANGKALVGTTADVEITAFDTISNVNAGTAGSATYANAAAVIAALPTTVTANDGAVTVPVTTWVDTDTYNAATAGSYTFTATLGTIPNHYANTGSYTATVEVVVG